MKRLFVPLLVICLLSGCASLGPYTVELSEPPAYFVENNINPLEDVDLENNVVPVFYAIIYQVKS